MIATMVRAVAPTSPHGIPLPLLIDCQCDESGSPIKKTLRIFPFEFPDDYPYDTLEFKDAIVGDKLDNNRVPELADAAFEFLLEIVQGNVNGDINKKLYDGFYGDD